MNGVLKAALLFALLLLLVGVLIVLPAYLFGVSSTLQAQVAAAGYIVFFSNAVWRGTQHGGFVASKDDKQVQHTGGRLAAAFRIAGLLGVHWLAPYTVAEVVSTTTIDFGAPAMLGVALMLIAFGVNFSAMRTLGRFWDKLVIKENHRVVRDGIYSVIRHPIYTSYIMLFVGYCFLYESWLSLVLLAAVSVVWFGSRIKIEENMLVEKFGDEYRDYMKRTKRLFPFVY